MRIPLPQIPDLPQTQFDSHLRVETIPGIPMSTSEPPVPVCGITHPLGGCYKCDDILRNARRRTGPGIGKGR